VGEVVASASVKRLLAGERNPKNSRWDCLISRRAKIMHLGVTHFLSYLIQGVDVAGEGDAESPGAGRAKLRLSRGLRLASPDNLTPKILARIVYHYHAVRRS
jgi:hypothetical protein